MSPAEPTLTALVVPVPEAERLVSRLRRRFDPQALDGVPAHVTLIVPFVRREQVDDPLLDELAELFARFPPFAFRLTGLAAFRGVLWLAPEPAGPFRRLIAALERQYPEHPPYGGRFDDVIPHVTLSTRDDPEAVEEVGRQTYGALPIDAVARRVWLMQRGDDAYWEARARFALGHRV